MRNSQLIAAVAAGAKDYIKGRSIDVCHANILDRGESLKHWHTYSHIVTRANLRVGATLVASSLCWKVQVLREL